MILWMTAAGIISTRSFDAGLVGQLIRLQQGVIPRLHGAPGYRIHMRQYHDPGFVLTPLSCDTGMCRGGGNPGVADFDNDIYRLHGNGQGPFGLGNVSRVPLYDRTMIAAPTEEGNGCGGRVVAGGVVILLFEIREG